MSQKRESNLWNELYFFQFIGASVVIVLLVAIYFIITFTNPNEGSNWAVARLLALSVIANLIPIFVLFTGSYALFRRIQTLRSERDTENLASKISSEIRTTIQKESFTASSPNSTYYEEFKDVPWHELLSTCSTLDICVHYFDTWINEQSDLIEQLFNRGGAVRIILPNHNKDDVVQIIKQRFPEYSANDIKTKISNTHRKLALLLKKSTHKNARVETYYINDMTWYTAIRFDRRVLVLSVYEHMREMRIGSPAIMISLGKSEKTQQWIEKEFLGLIDKSVEKISLDGRM